MIKAQCIGFVNTPPLWEGQPFSVQQFEFPQVDLTNFQPRATPKNIRLGHQMEHVFQQLVEYGDDYEILLHNQPIRSTERTLGEIDFILKKKTSEQIIHVELTYKFYLIDAEIPDPIHRLIGPNRKDSFVAKMEKIKDKQFPLLHTAEGRTVLNHKGIDQQNLVHQSCFKAQVFQPFGQTNVHLGPLNTDCLAGFWMRLADFNLPEFESFLFYLPSKSEWVIAPHAHVDWKSHAEIQLDIEVSLKQEKAPMLWAKRSETIFEKLFVVWW